jgi:hypothetical protein
MGSRTYLCAVCGGLRRREAVYPHRDKPLPDDYPRCCSTPMLALRKGWGEAAMHIDAAERVVWVAGGAHILRKAGGKWRAALTERQIRASIAQVEDLNARIKDLSKARGRDSRKRR